MFCSCLKVCLDVVVAQPGKARRRFKSNMQRRKVRFADGTTRRMWVRVKDLKSGIYDNPNKKDFAKASA